MRKIIAHEMVSVYGFFAGPDGKIYWFVWDDTLRVLSIRTLAGVDTLLFGRVTYEGMAMYWPTAKEDPVIAKAMNTLPKIVFSTSLNKADWNNTRVVKEIDPEDDYEDETTAGQGHGDLWQWHSGLCVCSSRIDR